MPKQRVTRRDAIKGTAQGLGTMAAVPLLDEGRKEEGPVQVTVILDSGTFLEEPDPSLFRVGYFNPEIVIYGDGDEVAQIVPETIGASGKTVEILHTDAHGRSLGRGVSWTPSLSKQILRLEQIYGVPIAVVESSFHCILRFDGGHFTSSMRKRRAFKEVASVSGQPTGKRVSVGPIAHNVAVHYALNPAEALRILCGGAEIWSSASHPAVKRRFDVEILADNSTAEMFYRHARVLGGETYFLPNQGDPPPDTTGGRP